jgi:hypothetical protein
MRSVARFTFLKNRTWLLLLISVLSGAVLAAPIPTNASMDEMTQAWYPSAYPWFALAFGFFCAVVRPTQIWIYPVGVLFGPFFLSLIFNLHDPSGLIAWIIFFAAGLSALGAIAGWFMRFCGAKLMTDSK